MQASQRSLWQGEYAQRDVAVLTAWRWVFYFVIPRAVAQSRNPPGSERSTGLSGCCDCAQHDVVVCAASQGVYQAIKRNTWGQYVRREQERIAWDVAWRALWPAI